MNTAPYKGALLHGNGDVISQAIFTHRMSIPSGARAFNIFAAIDFENSEPVTRLWVCAWLRPLAVPYTSVAANNLITSIQSLGVYGTQVRGHPDAIGRQSFYSLPVDPVQSAYYVSNLPRKQSGLGLWTLDASKGDLQLRTAGLDSQRGKYRTCQPIVVTTEHLLTGDYIWAFKFLLQLGDTQSVAFDEEATLQWLSVRPRPGF
jgi:hypothetical protein